MATLTTFQTRYRLHQTQQWVNNDSPAVRTVVLCLRLGELCLSKVLKMLQINKVNKLVLQQDIPSGDRHWADIPSGDWDLFIIGVAAVMCPTPNNISTLKCLELSQSVFVTSENEYKENRLRSFLYKLRQTPIEMIKLTHVKHDCREALVTMQAHFPNLKKLELTNSRNRNNDGSGLPHEFAVALKETITQLGKLEKIGLRRLVFAEPEKAWTAISKAIFPRVGLIVDVRNAGVHLTEPLREILNRSGGANVCLGADLEDGPDLEDAVDALVFCHGSVNLTYMLLRHHRTGSVLRNALPVDQE